MVTSYSKLRSRAESRRSRLRDFSTAAALVCLAGSVAACHFDHRRVQESADHAFRFPEQTDPWRVRVRVDDGSIRVVGHDGAELEIDVEVVSRSHSSETASSLIESMQIDAQQHPGEVLVTARRDATGLGRFSSLRANVEIRVPNSGIDTELDLFTGDGRVQVQNVNGTLQVETTDGRIEVDGVSGSLNLRASDGSIAGDGLQGDVDADSEDGRIRLSGIFGRIRANTRDGSIDVTCSEVPILTDDWSLRTTDGAIRVRLPKGSSAELDASTADGRIINHLEEFEGRHDRDYLRGRLGSGGKLIQMKTFDGRITLSADP